MVIRLKRPESKPHPRLALEEQRFCHPDKWIVRLRERLIQRVAR
jgi:hypothetical protein